MVDSLKRCAQVQQNEDDLPFLVLTTHDVIMDSNQCCIEHGKLIGIYYRVRTVEDGCRFAI